MYIAMNRFKILCGNESEFEKIWRERDSHLNKVDGFVEFNLLKGASDGVTTLYASHTNRPIKVQVVGKIYMTGTQYLKDLKALLDQ